uniref:Cysteine-rich DPF motif domain-containing protein 1 n=1 Tax=Octopus bimaculoides TaxID=37653 RepID=A0A0L8HTY8_OCTBM|eukprot:XP_014769393.1 PREDICTED: cysteine-rich DPF motif domain-containing protein 1-like [Octopus bimaculoides]
MDESNSDKSTKKFVCEVCNFSANYQYVGDKPPKCKSVTLKEKMYIMNNPFSSNEENSFIALGSHCIYCNIAVCADSKCSFYYNGRFCLNCCSTYISEFPIEVQQEIRKKMNS